MELLMAHDRRNRMGNCFNRRATYASNLLIFESDKQVAIGWFNLLVTGGSS